MVNKTRGGGLLLYKEGLKIFKIDAGTKCCEDYTILTVRLELVGVKEIYCIFVYRPPDGDISNYIDGTEPLIYSLTNKTKYEVNIIGDININLNKSRDVNVKRYKDFLRRNDLINILDMDTCYNQRQGSLIDHFVTSEPQLYQQKGKIQIYVSHHYIIFGARRMFKDLHLKIKLKARKYQTWTKHNLLLI